MDSIASLLYQLICTEVHRKGLKLEDVKFGTAISFDSIKNNIRNLSHLVIWDCTMDSNAKDLYFKLQRYFLTANIISDEAIRNILEKQQGSYFYIGIAVPS